MVCEEKFKVGNVEMEIKIKEFGDITVGEFIIYYDVILTNITTGKSIDYLDYDFIIFEHSDIQHEQLMKIIYQKVLHSINHDIDIVNHNHEKVTYQEIVNVVGNDWIDEVKLFIQLSR